MMNIDFRLLFFVLLSFILLSCVQKMPDEETLILYARAVNMYAEGHFSESINLLSNIKNFSPALTLKGKAHFFNNHEKEAEKSLRIALKLNPSDTEASLFLARLLREKGGAVEAEEISKKLLSGNSSDLRVLRLAADIAGDKGPSGEAARRAYLDRAAEASSEAALIFLDRASLRWIKGDAKDALKDLDRARAVLPEGSPLIHSINNLESIIKNVLASNSMEVSK